jgi:restriction system protein
MSLWLVRAGRHGEQEEGALQHGVAAIGWNELSDLSTIKSRKELRGLYEKVYPHEKPSTVSSGVGQLWAFIHRIQPKDLVVLPLKLHAAIAIGRITGMYAYRTDLSPNMRHIHPVEWLRTDLPRTSIEPDLLYSFGSLLTVCQVQRNHAEQRVQALLTGKPPATSQKNNKGNEEPNEFQGAISQGPL